MKKSASSSNKYKSMIMHISTLNSIHNFWVAVCICSAGFFSCALAAEELPVRYNYPTGFEAFAENLRWQESPPGANDSSCIPSDEHPHPVVLVHATAFNQWTNFLTISPLLANEGYCVYSLNYGELNDDKIQQTITAAGFHALDGINNSVPKLASLIDEVLTSTGATKLDVVAHSQGGVLTRAYLNQFGGEKVGKLVTLSSPFHGTDMSGLTNVLEFLLLGAGLDPNNPPLLPGENSLVDQWIGSDFVAQQNLFSETVPGVTYTNIATGDDWFITPNGTTTMSGEDPNSTFLEGSSVTNVYLQDYCKMNFIDHFGLFYDRNSAEHILNALDPANAKPVGCYFTPPIMDRLKLPDVTPWHFPLNPYLGRKSNGTDHYYEFERAGSVGTITNPLNSMLQGTHMVSSIPWADMDDDWAAVPDGDGFYLLINRIGSLCMEQSGSYIKQFECNGSNSQRWRFTPRSSDYYWIVNRQSELCVTRSSEYLFSFPPTPKLKAESCSDSNHKKWRIKSGGNLPAQPEHWTPPEQGPDLQIGNLSVSDFANAPDWSVRDDIQEGDNVYGDRSYYWTTIPSVYQGLRWIRSALESYQYSGNPLVTFDVNRVVDVVVGVPGTRPGWMDESWVDTGERISSSGAHYPLYGKRFFAGKVSLPAEANPAGMYVVLIKEVE